MNDSQTDDKLVRWAMAVLCHDSRILSEKGGEVDEEDALKRCFGERGCFMERPEKGCPRESRESMPQVKGLKELTLPVWQQQKGSCEGLERLHWKVPHGCPIFLSNDD
jgi:hypothetical protein